MKQLQSILNDLENKAITKHQAYDIILVLFGDSVSLLRSKAKEYAKFKHQDEYDDPIYHRDVLETLNDFEEGYKAALKDCNPPAVSKSEEPEREALAKLIRWAVSQKDCPTEFQDIVNKEFWNLI